MVILRNTSVRNTSVLLVIALAAGALTACSGLSVSPKVVRVEYEPAQGSLPEHTWIMDYDDDGRLVRVERETDGVEDVESAFTYDGTAFASFEHETSVGSIRFAYDRSQADTTYTTIETDARVALAGCAEALRLDGEGVLVAEWSGNHLALADFELDASGRCASFDDETVFSFDTSQRTRTENVFADGLLMATLNDNTNKLSVHSNDVEVLDTTTRHDVELDFLYQEGQLVQLEQTATTDVDDERLTQDLEVALTYENDAYVVEMDFEHRIENDQVDDELEFDYTNDGFIRRIEDRAGNRWTISYEEGNVSGAVFSLSGAVPAGHLLRLDGTAVSHFERGHIVDLMGAPLLSSPMPHEVFPSLTTH